MTGQTSEQGIIGRAPSLAPLLLAATGISAGLAYYMGWQYEKAYLEEWGIPFAASNYRPQDLMVASASVLTFALLVPVSAALGLFIRPYLDALDKEAGVKETTTLNPLSDRATDLLIGAALIGYLAYSRITGATETFYWLLLVGGLMLGVRLYTSPTPGSSLAAAVLLTVGLMLIVFQMPDAFGASDARGDMGDLAQFPEAVLLLDKSAPELAGGDGTDNRLWRIIRSDSEFLSVAQEVDDQDSPRVA